MKRSGTDTIAAIATPLGEGGISVIRISGILAIPIADKVFKGKSLIAEVGTHTAHFGRIINKDGKVIDDVVATVFLAPNSYTGENSVEISCHGGILVTQRILELILNGGARHAEPGEFTKRAFLNGKLDLSQAEAVADLIHARSDSAHRASVQQLEGMLSDRIRQIRTKLIDSIGLLELELDFSEEGLEFIDKVKFQNSVEEAVEEINRLVESFKSGRVFREGVKVVIAGPPNAGKSSLLNALLKSNRSIVTDVPGTTRDTIEESVVIGDISFRLVDTAGLRVTNDVVELEGVKRTENEARTSDIILIVLDGSTSASSPDLPSIVKFLKSLASASNRRIFVLNKSDLPNKPTSEILNAFTTSRDPKPLRVSALMGSGLKDLEEVLVEMVFGGKERSGETSATVTNLRHFDALNRAKESLTLSLDSLEHRQSNEFVAVDLRNALDCLGEVTGEVTSEEILNNIFSKFCIGK
jgi:tRNA modification GTPase